MRQTKASKAGRNYQAPVGPALEQLEKTDIDNDNQGSRTEDAGNINKLKKVGGLVETIPQQHPGKTGDHIDLHKFQADPQNRPPPGTGQTPAFSPGVEQGPKPPV